MPFLERPVADFVDLAMGMLIAIAMIWLRILRNQNAELRAAARPDRAVVAPSSAALLAIVERDLTTGMLVGYIPSLHGAHTQGSTLDEVRDHLMEVVQLVAAESPSGRCSELVAILRLERGATQ